MSKTKAKQQSAWADSQREAAKALGTSVEALREARAAGCPGFLHGRIKISDVRRWLIKQKSRRKPSGPAPLPDVAGDEKGAVAALHRLETAEAAAYRAMTKATLGGNPDRIAGARRNWLSISESLRKFDLAIEDHRRKTGELVQRGDIERALSALGYCLHLASKQIIPQVTHEARGAADEIAARGIIRRCNYDVAVVSYSFLSALGVPGWMVDCLSKTFTSHTTATPADIARYATIIKQGVDALAAQTIADVKAELAAVEPARP